MRILYLNPCGQMGGAETSLRELLASIRVAAPDWELFLILGEDGPMAGRARELGVGVSVVPFPAALGRIGDTTRSRMATLWSLLRAAGSTALYARRLAAEIRLSDPDIVHTNGFKMHLLGAWACPRRVPLVWHLHDYVSTRPLMSRLLRRYAKRCATAIVNSDSVGSDVKTLTPSIEVTTIYNAVDLRRFAPTGSVLDLDSIAGLSPAAPGTIRVGLVGTFARWKGHKVFMHALSMLPPEASIRGYVIGGPIYQTGGSQWSLRELRQEVSQRGLGERVGFTGFLDDTAAAMRSLDIIVHASTEAEPFGMVIIEGMACGRAVIASQGGGAEEIIEDGKDAAGHPPGDAEALSAQILRLASDNRFRSTLGRTGRAKAERLFNGERLSGQVIAVYRNVTNKKDLDSILTLRADVCSHSDSENAPLNTGVQTISYEPENARRLLS